MSDHDKKPKPPPDEQAPPGDFLSEHLREETARFLDEVKRRVRKRMEPSDEPKLGPPRREN